MAVFASGNGGNFQSIHKFLSDKEENVRLRLLVSNKSNCGAMEYAHKVGVDRLHISSVQFQDYQEYSAALVQHLSHSNIGFIVLAGYLKKIPDEIINEYLGKIINIHPSLLPKYGGKGMYGINVHKAVLEAKETESGFTIHHVTKNYDEGQIIVSMRVSVELDDTPFSLQEKIMRIEHEVYPRVIYDLCLKIE